MKSISQIAEETGVPASAILRWLRQHKRSSIQVSPDAMSAYLADAHEAAPVHLESVRVRSSSLLRWLLKRRPDAIQVKPSVIPKRFDPLLSPSEAAAWSQSAGGRSISPGRASQLIREIVGEDAKLLAPLSEVKAALAELGDYVRVTPEIESRVKALRERGLAMQKIAQAVGVSHDTVSRILDERRPRGRPPKAE